VKFRYGNFKFNIIGKSQNYPNSQNQTKLVRYKVVHMVYFTQILKIKVQNESTKVNQQLKIIRMKQKT
jgi:hypothetical protein